MTRSPFLPFPTCARILLALFALLLGAMATPAVAQQDLSLADILSPQSGCALTANENVSISIFNYGPTLPAGTTFNVTYTINGGAPVIELATLASSLTSNSTRTYTFTTQADLAATGTYTFDAAVALPGDVSPANDAFNGYQVTNSAPSVGGTIVATPPSASSGTLTLSGNTGSVLQWEESDDGGLRWYELANATTTQPFANLRATTQFRARVRNGSCAEVLSNTATVTP